MREASHNIRESDLLIKGSIRTIAVILELLLASGKREVGGLPHKRKLRQPRHLHLVTCHQTYDIYIMVTTIRLQAQ
jgi:hypothetical protein